MNKSNVAKFFKNAKVAVTKHSPEILTGIGIAGMVVTTVLAVKATPKALKLMELKKEENEVEKLTVVETVKTTWKCYIPATLMGTASVACLVGASSVSARRNAALATAYALSETALTDYRKKVIETLGEKKNEAVRDAIAKEKVANNPVTEREVIITDKGSTLCYDVISGRYFKSDMDTLKRVENEINRRMLRDTYVSLNEFYYEIGLRETKIGDDLGWNANDGLIEIWFSSQLADDGTPCLVLNYRVAPRYDYSH